MAGRGRISAMAGALGAAVLAVGGAAAPSAADPAEQYVALGDSYTSAPGVPAQIDANCVRSDHNYPHLVAQAVGVASFTDVSCGGATTAEMWRSQGTNPPQLDAISKKTTMVSLTIGGNDIGFGEIMGTCARLGATDPAGAPCTGHYTAGGNDILGDRIATASGLVDKVVDAIHDRAPRARVYVLGYPPILPETGPGCWPRVTMAAGDAPYMRTVAERLNAMLEDVAVHNRAQYVDDVTPAIGHDACQPESVRWIEGAVPESPSAPFHPNALGEQGMADALLATLAEPGRGRG